MISYEHQTELLLSGVNEFRPRNGTNNYKHDRVLHEIQRHRENKASNINFRRNVLEHQKRNNYTMEYDRLRMAMLSGLVTESSKRYINLRLGTIKDLAHLSIHGKRRHQIFEPKEYEQKTDKEQKEEFDKMNKRLNNRPNRVKDTLIVTPRDATVYA